MKIVKRIFKNLINRFPFLNYLYFKFIRQNNRVTSLLYKPEDMNPKYYQSIKKLGYPELEHQIGRISNYKAIVNESKNLKGDLIEFGTWKGFSLLWICYWMERAAIFNKKVVGLDGFIGLPYADGVFAKYDFADTSLDECRDNMKKNDILYPETIKNIYIEKFLFNQKAEILNFLKTIGTQKFCFIHIDCDISQSVVEIFDLLFNGNLVADKAYILFDDYGCESKLQSTVDTYFKKISKKWSISTHSSTVLTRNFLFIKK